MSYLRNEVLEGLQSGFKKVAFTKVTDQTYRVMDCTLDPAILEYWNESAPDDAGTGPIVALEIVGNNESCQWRCFWADTVHSIDAI